MIETSLENTLKALLASQGVVFDTRTFRQLYRDITNKDGRKQCATMPWFCATDEELHSLLEKWCFFHQNTYQRLLINYTFILHFYTLAQHEGDDTQRAECTKTPNRCKHTRAFIDDFFCKPEEIQEYTVDHLITKNFFSDCLTVSDVNISGAPNTLLRIHSEAEFQLDETGSFQIKGDCVYHAEVDQALEKFHPKGRYYASEIERRFITGIPRAEIGKHPDVFRLMKNFVAQEYAK